MITYNEVILKTIELISLVLLIYSLINFSGNELIIILITVFGVLAITGSTWFFNSKKITKRIPTQLRKQLIKTIIIGSIVLLLFAISLIIIYSGGS